MSYYNAPLDDIRFNFEAFDYAGKLASLPAFEDFDLETAMTLLEEYTKFCEGELLPLNESADCQGLVYNPEDKPVTTPDGFKAAYEKFVENGFLGLSHPEEYGGMARPTPSASSARDDDRLQQAPMCPGLQRPHRRPAAHAPGGAQGAVPREALQRRVVRHHVPHRAPGGTDLGLLTTKAEEYGDHYKITGTKIWITFGEHDLAENIVHLVLGRLPGAPEGIKGISTFIVPKYKLDGTYNNVSCGGLEHKMGIHASPTCVINLDGSEGWLVGEPNKGMRTMFIMMNAARLSVGIEGYALAEAAYQDALAFAKDRRQSRSLNPQRNDPDAKADNILVHPDVRRMLLNCKSTNEAMRGLATWIAINEDLSHHAEDPDEKQKASDLVALLTPIMKSYGSERGFQNTSEAMQVMGGAGYTQDWPVEQYVRDVRIAMIYEGTNHIQALDLVGRKLPRGGGRLLMTFAQEAQEAIAAASAIPALAPHAEALGKQAMRLQQVTMDLGAKAQADTEEVGAAASNYLNFFALVTLGVVWLKQLVFLDGRDDAFARGKRQTARFFFEMVLPEATLFAKRAGVGKGPMMDCDIDLL